MDEPKFVGIYGDFGIVYIHPREKRTTGWRSLGYWAKTKRDFWVYNNYGLKTEGLLPVEYFQ